MGITAYLQLISFHGVGKIKPSYDSFILGLIIRGLKSESKSVFQVNPVQGGQNQNYTASLGIGFPIYGQPPDGLVGCQLSSFNGLCLVFDGVNSMMKSAKTCPLIAILGLYLMSNSLSSMAHFISLPKVSSLCNTCFIGCSIGISKV